ncbi:MAG: glycosyltransferase family 2 protein [Phycisphaerae bacterium]|nr:glycosyltransferase family 2 protein [Phycisphaerae bacterium]
MAIVCRDNERTLGRTLDSVRGLADEIVAVDSGSTDGTIGLLERAGARVIRSAWLGYVRTKQLALDACRGDWVLCLDSDESVEADLAGAVRGALARTDAVTGVSGFAVNRVIWYRGRFLRHAWQPEWRLRLVRRGAARWTGEDPHDRLELVVGGGGVDGRGPGRVERLRGTLRHDSFETFAEHLVKQLGHARTHAAALHGAGERGSLVSLVVSPPAAFVKQVLLRRAFLDGWPGWLAAASSAAGALMKHAALIERGRGGDGVGGSGDGRDGRS